jgi:universal stress protein A
MTLFRRILVPYDFSAPATVALETAAELARARGGRLTVLHVMMPFYPPEQGIVWLPETAVVERAERHLAARVARVLGRRGVGVKCRVMLGTPLRCIMEAARDADSIVISTLGRTGVPRLVMGSVAERVVRHAPVPVLVVRRRPRRRRAVRRARRRAHRARLRAGR